MTADPTSRPGLHLPPEAAERPGESFTARASVFAPDADAVEVCLVDSSDGWPTDARLTDGRLTERRVPLTRSVHGTFVGDVPQVRSGQRYGLRAHGPWEPERGLLFNPATLLLDPYARAVDGTVAWGQPVFAHAVDEAWRPAQGTLTLDPSDSLGHVPLGVALPELSHAPRGPVVPWERTVVYEAHVKGLTARHPQVPAELRGTWAGLAHPAVVEHLLDLGVTTVELLPVFAKADETHLVRLGLSNYWGYNHLSFFAPEPSYATRQARETGPHAVVAEVVSAIETLHRAGLEVVLDVVYNHTCEGGHGGPSLSWRGLAQRSYYRLDEQGRSVDFTGTGNTVDFSSPEVCRLVLDSLRHWVQVYGVDGFRFDLAPALGRGDGRTGRDGFDPDHPFLVALRSDPVLSGVKLIAEPWDVGPFGWRTGEFPTPFAEWNDRYRDTSRAFWVADRAALADPGRGQLRTTLSDLATRLVGSADLFATSASVDRLPRPAWAGVNFVTAHDGFTLTDLISYDDKHNLANGEDNRDGSEHNLSFNHGVEGPASDRQVLLARHRTRLALLSTLLLSVGTPMLTAGDELARTQGGNNNAYCQDTEIGWVDWAEGSGDDAAARRSTQAAVRELLRLRAAHSVLTPAVRPHGRVVADDGTTDVSWFGLDGAPMTSADWHDSHRRSLQLVLDGRESGSASVLLVVHGTDEPAEMVLPIGPWGASWRREWDSAAAAAAAFGDAPSPVEVADAGQAVQIGGCCVALFTAA